MVLVPGLHCLMSKAISDDWCQPAYQAATNSTDSCRTPSLYESVSTGSGCDLSGQLLYLSKVEEYLSFYLWILILIQVGLFLFIGPLSLAFFVYLCYTDYYLVSLCYLCWYFWDIPSSTNGGRSGPLVNWMRWTTMYLCSIKFLPKAHHIYAIKVALSWKVLDYMEVQRGLLPCFFGQDRWAGPQEESSHLLPSSWHTLLWSCG